MLQSFKWILIFWIVKLKMPSENPTEYEIYHDQSIFLYQCLLLGQIRTRLMIYVIFLLSKETLTHYCNMYFQYTLLADIFHSSSQLFLKKLTFLCNFLSLLKEVLGSSLH